MFKLFQRKRPADSPVKEKTVNHIQQFTLAIQTRFARQMSQLEQRLSAHQRRGAFVLFCVAMTGMCSFWFYQGISGNSQTKPAYLKRNNIVQPENTILPDSLDLDLLEEFQRQRDNQRFTDSTKP